MARLGGRGKNSKVSKVSVSLQSNIVFNWKYRLYYRTIMNKDCEGGQGEEVIQDWNWRGNLVNWLFQKFRFSRSWPLRCSSILMYSICPEKELLFCNELHIFLFFFFFSAQNIPEVLSHQQAQHSSNGSFSLNCISARISASNLYPTPLLSNRDGSAMRMRCEKMRKRKKNFLQ
jgi:hypothetical protein